MLSIVFCFTSCIRHDMCLLHQVLQKNKCDKMSWKAQEPLRKSFFSILQKVIVLF